MKSFKLTRKEDVSGVSGVGVVAEGVEFHDGQVVMSWFGQHHTLEIAPTIESVIAIHGHNGLTTVVWDGNGDLACVGCGSQIELHEPFTVQCMRCDSESL